MNDEIKEIEEWLRDISTPTGLSYSGDRTLSNSMVDHIIDYIINLQEELEEQKRIEQADFKTIQNLEEENERLKQSILNAIDKMNSEMVIINDRGYYYTDISALEDILQINDKDFIDYKSRNEKAIEYNYELQERYCHSALYDDLVASKIYEISEKNIKLLNGSDEEC